MECSLVSGVGSVFPVVSGRVSTIQLEWVMAVSLPLALLNSRGDFSLVCSSE